MTRDAGVYLLCLCLVLISGIRSVHANSKSPAEQASDAEIAKELANPIADLIHIPVQINYNQNIGPDDDGWRVQTNIQPVIPFHMNDDWNLITRTIVPLIHQEDIFSGSGSQSGLGDTTISLLFSPKEPDSDGIIWGAGPIMQLPTATDSKLGTEKWGMGPSGIALRQNGPWTIGGLGHHIWSFAGDDDRDDLSITFLQPFVAYTWPSSWAVSAMSESGYNWKTEGWSVPLNVATSKVVRWGKIPVRLQAMTGYWLDSPDEGPEGFNFRFQLNFVLPK